MRGRDQGTAAWRWGLATVLFLALLALLPERARALRHGGGTDRVGLFETLHIAEDQAAGDVACAFCTVEIDGEVHGDVAVLFSTLVVAPGRSISGDVAGLFSTLRLGPGAAIGGDLAWTMGTSDLAPGSEVRGDRALLAAGGMGAVVLLAPLLIVIGVVWLVVWFVRNVL